MIAWFAEKWFFGSESGKWFMQENPFAAIHAIRREKPSSLQKLGQRIAERKFAVNGANHSPSVTKALDFHIQLLIMHLQVIIMTNIF